MGGLHGPGVTRVWSRDLLPGREQVAARCRGGLHGPEVTRVSRRDLLPARKSVAARCSGGLHGPEVTRVWSRDLLPGREPVAARCSVGLHGPEVTRVSRRDLLPARKSVAARCGGGLQGVVEKVQPRRLVARRFPWGGWGAGVPALAGRGPSVRQRLTKRGTLPLAILGQRPRTLPLNRPQLQLDRCALSLMRSTSMRPWQTSQRTVVTAP